MSIQLNLDESIFALESGELVQSSVLPTNANSYLPAISRPHCEDNKMSIQLNLDESTFTLEWVGGSVQSSMLSAMVEQWRQHSG